MASMISTDVNFTCPLSLLWYPSNANIRRPALYASAIATVTHSIFWLQLVFCPTVRQKTMQWIYAYLITDILLLFRFFFTFIVRTTSNECIPNRVWSLFICYFEAFVDIYLNITEVYILLALNICRYVQIAYNRNVYTTYVRSLICAHLGIYFMPVIIFVVQVYIDWAPLITSPGDSCYINYTNIYTQIFNIIFAFTLPISFNILVIYLSIRHVNLTSRLQRAQHHVSAREKYHRSLVIQFLIFYTIWLLLWSPNVISYQFTYRAAVLRIVRVLEFVQIALDPIIICALDVRFWEVWQNMWRHVKNRYFPELQPQRRQVQPIKNNPVIPLPPIQHIRPV